MSGTARRSASRAKAFRTLTTPAVGGREEIAPSPEAHVTELLREIDQLSPGVFAIRMGGDTRPSAPPESPER
jgi:hypothetical protein